MALGSAQRTGIAYLPLHYGKAPPWLFQRMVRLARAMTVAVVEDYGPEEILRRLSDPFWFQAFGCVLGFDWHSSGLTTTACGALKEGLKGLEKEVGLFVAGGKGGTSRKAPSEITAAGERIGLDPGPLVYSSRMSAKVDTSALQDGYQLYHHTFFFTSSGSWAVVQQGMNGDTHLARRYHWLGERVEDFVDDPHSGIASEARGKATLNLVATESKDARDVIPRIASEEKPERVLKDLEQVKTLELPQHHPVTRQDINPTRLHRVLLSTYQRKPESFEALLGMEGVGPKTIRALSLIAELVHGVNVSHRDPAIYAFAHGGKDGYPYPVDRKTYDATINFLSTAVERAKVGEREKLDALKQLVKLGLK